MSQVTSRRSPAQSPSNGAWSFKSRVLHGVSSPAQNVQAYNDWGFYLAEGGKDELALKFYRGVEAVGKRTVLMLNIADSLWRLDRKDEAQRYYGQYRDAMSAEGKARKIPQRVVERSVIQGMKN